MSARDISEDSDTSISPPTPNSDSGFVVVGTLTNAKNALSTVMNTGEGTLQLVSVPLPGSPSERSLGIFWSKVSSAPYFQSVRVRLTAPGQLLGEETLTWQRFPSSSAGMLSLSSIPSGTPSVAVQFRLWPSEDSDSWMRVLTAQCFGEPLPLFIALPGCQSRRSRGESSAGVLRQTRQDVCFAFGGLDLHLWGIEATLSTASDYLKTLLGPDFAEGFETEGPVTIAAGDDSQERLFEDSDDETDEICGDICRARSGNSTNPASPYKKVVVRQTAYTTYAATLVWVGCRRIEFAPLKSRAGPKRKDQLKTQFEANPALPAPASPKSVYRLAQILELADLKQPALENFAAQLTPENAANELFSEVISAFPELRESALHCVSKNWAGVKKTASWKKAEDQAARNELPACAMLTAILLASRVA